jgi:hypothetical protein
MKKLLSAAAVLLATVAVGSAVAGDQYDVTVSRPSAKAKERAVAKVSVSPKGPFHVNLEYPVKLSIVAPDGVKVEKEKQNKDDAKRFDKERLDFEVAFVSDVPGKKSFSGVVRFAVCTDTDCKPTSENVSFDVDVK